MEVFETGATWFRDFLWSVYFLVPLLLGAGLLLTLRLKFIQTRKLGHSINLTRGFYDDDDDPGEVSHFQALTSALSSTVGTGNIAGVATAIASGGPGAIFWMWLTGAFGMASKYAECMMAVHYREITDDGVVRGGPMFYIAKGLGGSENVLLRALANPFALLFAFCMMLAPLAGGGMAQANSAADALSANFGVPPVVTGVVRAILVGIVILGGIKRIGAVTGKLVPFMGVVYAIGVLFLLIMNWEKIPTVVEMIFHYAFNPMAAVGGFAGATIGKAISFGAARGVFSNEAGLGTAPIAHAAAKTKEPVREGLVAMMEPMIDTLGINTMTALAILCTDSYETGHTGASLTTEAFDRGLPGLGGYIVAVAMAMFAVSTSITQAYYGNRATDFLFGRTAATAYRWFFCVVIFIGSVTALQLVWTLADIANALLAIPNLLTLIVMSGFVVHMTKDYFSRPQLTLEERQAEKKIVE